MSVSSNSQPMRTTEVFFSYSHKDEGLRDELATHLSILRRQGVISAWYDRQITPGTEWAGEINTHLNSSEIILLLISPDFLASDYCFDIELRRAMERHERGEARVIPIILRPVDWQGASFGKLQALPKNAKAITLWDNRDEAFRNVCEGIRIAIKDFRRFSGFKYYSEVAFSPQDVYGKTLNDGSSSFSHNVEKRKKSNLKSSIRSSNSTRNVSFSTTISFIKKNLIILLMILLIWLLIGFLSQQDISIADKPIAMLSFGLLGGLGSGFLGALAWKQYFHASRDMLVPQTLIGGFAGSLLWCLLGLSLQDSVLRSSGHIVGLFSGFLIITFLLLSVLNK
ncbi:MAG: toll/interleukin-1 receptor domain-containing protein [Oculatellaceae cyanobacterium bins.114]|nr:toll/interleukin-1 receptor domain-containing protein [Oculatellaceae cyanobacterium bins.114]